MLRFPLQPQVESAHDHKDDSKADEKAENLIKDPELCAFVQGDAECHGFSDRTVMIIPVIGKDRTGILIDMDRQFILRPGRKCRKGIHACRVLRDVHRVARINILIVGDVDYVVDGEGSVSFKGRFGNVQVFCAPWYFSDFLRFHF